MRVRKAGAAVWLVIILLSGCITSEPLPAELPEEELVALSARFQTEDGTTLEGSTAQFSFGDSGDSYLLDADGMVKVPGLPRDGEVKVTLLDRRQEEQGAMTLSLSCGAVIDATTGGDGVGHITLRSDTTEIALLFTLEKDSALRCALWFTSRSE